MASSPTDPDVVGRSRRDYAENRLEKSGFISHRIAVIILFSWGPGNDGSANEGADRWSLQAVLGYEILSLILEAKSHNL